MQGVVQLASPPPPTGFSTTGLGRCALWWAASSSMSTGSHGAMPVGSLRRHAAPRSLIETAKVFARWTQEG